MDNTFEIPITYQGKEYVFPAMLITYGYSFKIEVNVFDTMIYFEPDEERNYRALIDPEELHRSRNINIKLLQLISEQLETLFRDDLK